MDFLLRCIGLVFDSLPWAIVFPLPAFVLIAGVILARQRSLERRILGRSQASFWRELAVLTTLGVLAGFGGTVILFYLGIAVDMTGFAYVLPVALLLMLLDLRFLCLAYAGGLLSLVSLVCGLPKMHLPGLLALVAILHLMESVLIRAGGGRQAVPLAIRRGGVTMGGYLLQQIWPLPLIALTAAAATGAERLTYLREPFWWPLIPPPIMGAGFIFLALPAAAMLGYSDLTVTSSPRDRAARTAGMLGLYSLGLLLLSFAAARVPLLAWPAALYAPIGHELVLYLSRRYELRGRPAFTPGAEGVPILAVLAGTPAGEAGLLPGQVITAVNGHPVRSKAELLASFGAAGAAAVLAVSARPGEPPREYRLRRDPRGWGLIPAPDPGDPAAALLGPWRFLPGRKERPA